MKTSLIDNPNRELTDDETIQQLSLLLEPGTELLGINQTKNLILLKKANGNMQAFSYCVSHIGVIENKAWASKLEHSLNGGTHHIQQDFQKLFANKPVGILKQHKIKLCNSYVNVHRIGKRRKMIDEIGNIFLKVNGHYRLFPDQVSY